MKPLDFATNSFRHYRRSHLAVALGVAVATAVLTGALLVGDSVRGSLRELTLRRLERIDQALVTKQLFRAELASEIAANPTFQANWESIDPALLVSGSASTGNRSNRRYASNVSLVGTDEAMGPAIGKHLDAKQNEVAITRSLAKELAVAAGDEIVLRLPALSASPADSTLGEKSETTLAARVTVAKVLADEPLVSFSLYPTQRPARNVFLPLSLLQDLLDQPGKANALLVKLRERQQLGSPEQEKLLAKLLKPKLEDFGLRVEPLDGNQSQLVSDQLLLPDAVVDAAAKLKVDQQPIVTYLANTIKLGDRSIPYSTITGVDSTQPLGPLIDSDGQPIVLADNEIVLNVWAADRLEAKVGDTITITYYEPESTHGELVEAEPLKLKLKAIVPLTGKAADPKLTPEIAGVTDADSINDWDLPFELTEPITGPDEDYWDQYKTTPKAFVSFNLAKRLWQSRWGTISLMRFGASPSKIKSPLTDSLNPADLGFAFLPVKRQGLDASAGTTPFDGLFFGFSLFLIASTVMLVALLFNLGIEQRAREIGLLSAIGWDANLVRRGLMREGLLVAAAGVAIGVPLGVLYAWLMIKGLTTLWVAAIVSPFLTLHITTKSLLIGGLMGLLVAWLTIRLAVRRVVAQPPRALLAGQINQSSSTSSRTIWLSGWAAAALPLMAVFLGFIGLGLNGEAQAGAFFGSGAALLAGMLLALRGWLAGRKITQAAPERFGLWSLARRNVGRNAGRSLLTIALVAAASFLILAISAFRLAPSEQGTGGFELVAQSDQPIHYNLGTPDGRLELGFSDEGEQLAAKFTYHSFRVHDGEDASCLNLYQTGQPRVLGVPASFIQRANEPGKQFAFADSMAEATNTWEALLKPLGAGVGDDPARIPIVLDFNTAMYSLKLYGGVGSRLSIRDSAGRDVVVEVVGLLKNSILQGDLLMNEADFLRLYPETGGYRFFLVKANQPPKSMSTHDNTDKFAAMLEDRLSDYGLDTELATVRLAGFLAVQNTYLSTFQSLGALGLLLGAVGVAVVQLRNLTERRGELALLRAAGYSDGQLAALVMRENLLLLGGGLLVGALAAAAALLPQAMTNQTSLPWFDSGMLLLVIAAFGLIAGALATRSALKVSLVPALRGE